VVQVGDLTAETLGSFKHEAFERETPQLFLQSLIYVALEAWVWNLSFMITRWTSNQYEKKKEKNKQKGKWWWLEQNVEVWIESASSYFKTMEGDLFFFIFYFAVVMPDLFFVLLSFNPCFVSRNKQHNIKNFGAMFSSLKSKKNIVLLSIISGVFLLYTSCIVGLRPISLINELHYL
jgi:hypothetical protein